MFKKKSKVIEAIKGLANIADEYKFTNQERAEHNKKASDATIDHAKESMSENTVRSKTRRFIAVEIISVWLFLILLCALVWPLNSLWAEHILKVIALMSAAAFSVIAFFFGGYYLKGPVQAFTNRFKRKSKQ